MWNSINIETVKTEKKKDPWHPWIYDSKENAADSFP
jgi:hypothetical protein